MTAKKAKVLMYFICLSLLFSSLGVMNYGTTTVFAAKDIDGVFDSTFYTDSQKLTVDRLYTNALPVTEIGKSNDIKSEIWYNFDADFMYFYVKTTDPNITYTTDTWGSSDATSIFLDMNPSAENNMSTGDISVGVIGKSLSVVSASSAAVYAPGMFSSFKNTENDTYGFELKVAKKSGETSFGINVAVWDATSNQILAMGPQWWGNHSSALQYVKTDFYPDSQKITIDTAYNSSTAALIGKSIDVKSEVWYNWDDDYLYFYLKTTDPEITYTSDTWGVSDATSVFLDINPSANDYHGAGDASVGVIAKSMAIVSASSADVYASGMFHNFKEASSGSYGFELKVPRKEGELGFGINVAVWDSTNNQTLAMGPQWWGNHSAALKYIWFDGNNPNPQEERDTDFYRDDKKFTVDTVQNDGAAKGTVPGDVKSEIWYNWDSDYLYFYVQTTDTDITNKGPGDWYLYDNTAIYLDMDPSKGRYIDFKNSSSNHYSIGVDGQSLSYIVPNPGDLASWPGAFRPFRKTDDNIYGFELKVPRKEGELGFGINVVVWDYNTGEERVLAMGPCWYGNHEAALRYVWFNEKKINGIFDESFYTKDKMKKIEESYSPDSQMPADNTENVSGEVYYNWDNNYLYFYIKVFDGKLAAWDKGKITDFSRIDSMSLFLDPDPSSNASSFQIAAQDYLNRNEVSIGVVGSSLEITNISNPKAIEAGNVCSFILDGGYGMEFRWPQVPDEEGFRFNCAIYNSDLENVGGTLIDGPNRYTVATGSRWWTDYTTMTNVYYEGGMDFSANYNDNNPGAALRLDTGLPGLEIFGNAIVLERDFTVAELKNALIIPEGCNVVILNGKGDTAGNSETLTRDFKVNLYLGGTTIMRYNVLFLGDKMPDPFENLLADSDTQYDDNQGGHSTGDTSNGAVILILIISMGFIITASKRNAGKER